MSEENSPKEEKIKIHQEQPEIQKGQVPGVSEYTKLHSERGTLREGYHLSLILAQLRLMAVQVYLKKKMINNTIHFYYKRLKKIRGAFLFTEWFGETKHRLELNQ
jgi:hypothetical protein